MAYLHLDFDTDEKERFKAACRRVDRPLARVMKMLVQEFILANERDVGSVIDTASRLTHDAAAVVTKRIKVDHE